MGRWVGLVRRLRRGRSSGSRSCRPAPDEAAVGAPADGLGTGGAGRDGAAAAAPVGGLGRRGCRSAGAVDVEGQRVLPARGRADPAIGIERQLQLRPAPTRSPGPRLGGTGAGRPRAGTRFTVIGSRYWPSRPGTGPVLRPVPVQRQGQLPTPPPRQPVPAAWRGRCCTGRGAVAGSGARREAGARTARRWWRATARTGRPHRRRPPRIPLPAAALPTGTPARPASRPATTRPRPGRGPPPPPPAPPGPRPPTGGGAAAAGEQPEGAVDQVAADQRPDQRPRPPPRRIPASTQNGTR